MKIKSAVRIRCDGCKVIKREGKVYVYCKKSRRHNMKMGRTKKKVTLKQRGNR